MKNISEKKPYQNEFQQNQKDIQTCMNFNQISTRKTCTTNNGSDKKYFTIEFGNKILHKDFQDKNFFCKKYFWYSNKIFNTIFFFNSL